MVETRNADFALTNTNLTIAGETDALFNIEAATLTGGIGNNIIDAAAFTGPVILDGGAGDDTLTGGSGNDVLTGGLGLDTMHGGAGADRVVETRDANFTLTGSIFSASLIIGTDPADTLTSIEEVDLTGGDNGNTLDAAAFTGPVRLDGAGGIDTLIGGSGNDFLTGGAGDDLLLKGGAGHTRPAAHDGSPPGRIRQRPALPASQKQRGPAQKTWPHRVPARHR